MQTFPVLMQRLIIVGYLGAVVLLGGLVGWCFKSGFMWSGIFLVAIVGSMAVLYWYLIAVLPKRAIIRLDDQGVRVVATTGEEVVIPYGAISRAYRAELRDIQGLSAAKLTRGISLFGYRSGRYNLPGDRSVLVLSRRKTVIGIDTADEHLVLGPADLEGLASALEAKGVVIRGA